MEAGSAVPFEHDPYDASSTPRKHTALGRFRHECAEVHINKDGRVVLYSGDDERFDYLYKFVTAGKFDPINRDANKDLLDSGTLYVAKFNADGTMTWLPLVFGSQWLTPPLSSGLLPGVMRAVLLDDRTLSASEREMARWI